VITASTGLAYLSPSLFNGIGMPKGNRNMKMTVQFIGVARRHGKSAKTGNAYDICEVYYAHPLESKTTENYQFKTHGHEQRSIKLDPQAMVKFASFKLGDDVVLILGPDPQNPMRNICVDVG